MPAELERIFDGLKRLTPQQLARAVAFLFAPALVVLLACSGLPRSGLAVEMERPFAVSRLRTVLSSAGQHHEREGLVVLLEPSAILDYRIPLEAALGHEVWTSLSLDQLLSNRQRILVDERGVTGEAPLLGVTEPILVVLPSAPKGLFEIPGGSYNLEDWRLASRRSVALVSSVLLSCVFGLGISVTLAFPPKRRRTQTLK